MRRMKLFRKHLQPTRSKSLILVGKIPLISTIPIQRNPLMELNMYILESSIHIIQNIPGHLMTLDMVAI